MHGSNAVAGRGRAKARSRWNRWPMVSSWPATVRSMDAKGAAALALHRFGLGPRAGSIAAIASDPRGALLAEIEKPGAGQITDNSMLTAPQAARLAFHYNQEQQAKRLSARISEEQRKTTMAVMTPEEAKPDDP